MVEKYLKYCLQKGFIKSQFAFNTKKSQLKKGKLILTKKDLFLMDLLGLPLAEAFAKLQMEREILENLK